MKVSEIGEWRIIETLWSQLIRDPNEILGLNDDVVARRISRDMLIVAHVNTLTWRTDVLPGMSPHSIGYKSVIMNVSDMAAKGVKPLGILFSLGLPRDYNVEDTIEIARGWREAALKYGVYIWGGDISETAELTITGAIIGLTKRGRLISRRGAKVGDLIACIGDFGLTSVAYMILLKGMETKDKRVRAKALKAAYYPKAYLKEGLKLAKTGVITSSMDCSDGLAWSIHTLCKVNDVGAEIYKIPIPSEVWRYAEEHHLDPWDLALYGGEEYALIFTLKPNALNMIPRDLVRKMCIMGRITADKKVKLVVEGGERDIEARGWEHLR